MASIRRRKKELKRLLREAERDKAAIDRLPATTENLMDADAMEYFIRLVKESIQSLKIIRLKAK